MRIKNCLSLTSYVKVAMTGEECVAVCSDLRYGRELQTIATDFPKVLFPEVIMFSKKCLPGF